MISTVKPDEMHPHEAAQVGIPDAALGQRMFDFVKLAKRTTDTVVSEILRNVATRLASGKVSEGLELLDESLRIALSKVDRNMRQMMAGRGGEPGQIGGALSQPKRPDERRPARRAARNRSALLQKLYGNVASAAAKSDDAR